MFTKVGSWTDPQGTTHTDAVFEPSHSHYSTNTSDEFSFRIEDGDLGTSKSESRSSSIHLRYRMYYWTNQLARDNGLAPYVLTATDPFNDWFEVDSLDATYDGLTAVEKAEKHCAEVTLI